ncbi:hypothetical protein GZ78_05415 [Endozoicomonas numazuensis]|uniref:Uncharacterized protein n=2 Tax=Endozoicomonas numazuensis TaxID=1137799 RepID=A0A081NLS1_9GAMM|nr:hypothetical protein GZ78_05415 [Endozoicomonas numazuensis]
MSTLADDPDFIPVETGGEVLSTRNEANSHTFGLRAYTISSDDLSVPDAHSSARQNGLVVDYYPFESGFRVSAGTFSGDSKKLGKAYFSGEGRAYVGVGWKKLLDDAKRVDFSVDVGTFLDIQKTGTESAENTTIESTASTSLQRNKLDSKEQPVISLGIEFRF